jgi:hypothetical protein
VVLVVVVQLVVAAAVEAAAVAPCVLVLFNTRRGWENAPRWGERQRRWLAALLALPWLYLGLRVVQAITRVALLLCLVPRLVNVASCA